MSNCFLKTHIRKALGILFKKRMILVFVCANQEVTKDARDLLARHLPDKAVYSGRSVFLPNGSELHVLNVTECELAPDQDFSVLYLGWWDGEVDGDMKKWNKQAINVL